jgi:DNA-binding CsgD family transcriptional regulator
VSAPQARDLKRAADIMRVLVDPLAAPDIDQWRSTVNRMLIPLLDADSAGFLLPVSGRLAVYSDEHDPAELAKYPDLAPPPLSTGKPIFVRCVELGVSTLDEVWGDDMHINLNSAYFNDYVAPNRAHDALTAVIPLPRLGPHGMAGVQLWHERMEGRTFGARETALLRMILPALRIGVEACVRWDRHRTDLLSMLDHLGQRLLVCDVSGRVLHATPALLAAIEEDGEGHRLMRELHAVAAELGGLAASAPVEQGQPSFGGRSLATAHARYAVTGALYRSPIPSSPLLVLVTVERTTPVLRSAAELRDRYGLTRAEIRVAALLVSSLTSTEIAQQLNLSPHTVRRHTESILLKARVGSRAALATKLLR